MMKGECSNKLSVGLNGAKSVRPIENEPAEDKPPGSSRDSIGSGHPRSGSTIDLVNRYKDGEVSCPNRMRLLRNPEHVLES